jgi:glucose-1-phosphate adenylyltransferase
MAWPTSTSTTMMENSEKPRSEGAPSTFAAHDPAGRTVAIVLAGGKGTRLDPLTRSICKPALPFGGTYRCIDFSLSNCVNSGIRTIGVATQHKPDALLEHLWTHWNSAAVGDDAIVHAWRAEERGERGGSCGTADAVYRNLPSIRRSKPQLVLILAGDHVYKMDYRPLLEAHCAAQAAVTIGCVEASIEDTCELGVLAVADDGLVERLVEKSRCLADIPHATGDTAIASMGIYVFDVALLERVLRSDAAQRASGHDLAADILPQLIKVGLCQSYAFRNAGAGPAYWRDIGTRGAYWRAHMELLGPSPLLTLDDARWPIGRVARPPRIIARRGTTAAGGTVEQSIVPAKGRVAGKVTRSVLFDAVEIEGGAEVREAVVLPGAVVGARSRLRGVIVDAGYRVPDDTVVERYGVTEEAPVLFAHDARSRTSRRRGLDQSPITPRLI